MGFPFFESKSYCVGGRHRSATTDFFGHTTSKDSKFLNGPCSCCNSKKSITVSDHRKQGEGLGDLFKNLAKKGLKVSIKMTKNVPKVLDEPWNLEQTLVLHLHLGAP